MINTKKSIEAENIKNQRKKNQQHYQEITKAIEKDLLTSQQELALLEEENSLTEPSKLDYLWSICEQSKDRSKMILADSLEVPFYLPQNKVVYDKSNEQILREEKRLNFLIQRELKDLIPKKGRMIDTDSLIPPAMKLSPREKLVSNRLLHEYRKNPDRHHQLRQRLYEQQQAKKAEQLSIATSLAKKHAPTHEDIEKKIIEVKQRREQIMQEEIINKKSLKKHLEERLNQNSQKAKDILFNPLHVKQKLWMKVVSFLSIMIKIDDKVEEIRARRERSHVLWRKAIIIQKAFRKFKELRKGNISHEKLVMRRLRQSMIVMNPDSSKILQSRKEACTIITSFLLSIQKNWKNFALNYLRKIKVIQRKWRQHMFQNHFRCLLLLTYLERIFPLFMIHIHYIIHNKGYDLQNLLGPDLTILHQATKYYSFYHITKQMDNNHFHILLRNANQHHHNPNVLQQLMKFFGLFLHAPIHGLHQHHHRSHHGSQHGGDHGDHGHHRGNTAGSTGSGHHGAHHTHPPGSAHSSHLDSAHSNHHDNHHNRANGHHDQHHNNHHGHHGRHDHHAAFHHDYSRHSLHSSHSTHSQYSKFSAENHSFTSMPHPLSHNPDLAELLHVSHSLHQHNIRILTYHTLPEPHYYEHIRLEHILAHPSHHPFGYSYHKFYTLFDVIIKQCILEFIYKKRLAYIDKIDGKNLAIAKFNVNDIKSFIHGDGYDPLQAQLEEMMKKQEVQYLQHHNYQLQRSSSISIHSGSLLLGGAGGGGGAGNVSQFAEKNGLSTVISQALANSTKSSIPFTTTTVEDRPPLLRRNSVLTAKDLEDYDVYRNPHIYKNSQLTMLFLQEITAEDILQLLIQITEILQLIPIPYLQNNNYNHSYIYIVRNKYLKNLASSSSLTAVKGGGGGGGHHHHYHSPHRASHHRLSVPDAARDTHSSHSHHSRHSSAHHEQDNPYLPFHRRHSSKVGGVLTAGGLPSFPFAESSSVHLDHDHDHDTHSVTSEGRARRTTIQKGVHHHLALLIQDNEFYQELYEFFHHYANPSALPPSSQPSSAPHHPQTHRHSGSSASHDPLETKHSSREGSVTSQGSGGSNPISLAAIAAAASHHRHSSSAQISALRKSLLVGRSDMHRMSLLVTNHQYQEKNSRKASTFDSKRKTSVIPENKKKYDEKDDDDDDEDDDDDNDDDDNDNNADALGGRSIRQFATLSPKNLQALQKAAAVGGGADPHHLHPNRPTFIRRSSVTQHNPAASHRKLSSAMH